MAAKIAILAFMLHAFILAPPPANCAPRGFRATLIRREPTINFTRAARQSHARLAMLAARLDSASRQAPLIEDITGTYDIEISIGTPPLPLLALADTGSDLTWVKCGPCDSCTPTGVTSFDPAGSSSFSKMPCSDRLCGALPPSMRGCGADGTECDYRYYYGTTSDHYTQGYMGTDTFTLGSDAVPGIEFGCTTMSNGSYGAGSGLVGLSMGKLSLVFQLGVGSFSYCLTHGVATRIPLLFGSLATLSGDDVQSTKFLSSYFFYNVSMNSITIGTVSTPGPGTNGVVFDSGTTLTFLAEPAYTAAKTSILSQTSLPRVAGISGLEPCFQASGNDISSAVPRMVLHFDGAEMRLPVENYFVEVERGVVCWVVQPSSSLSIIGNIMQMNFQLKYDLDQQVLSLRPANCSSL